MPSRYIREGWVESEHIDQLTAESERFFLRLTLRADDFGRYSANPQLLKSNLLPLKSDVRTTDISRWLAECEKAGLVRLYEVDGKRFIQIPKFGQRSRAEKSKFPAPPSECQTNGSHLPGLSPASAPEVENENEVESENDKGANEVLAYLNQVAGTKFQSVDGSLKHIRARLKEGATVEQCKLVVDDRFKAWASNTKMVEYLRPQTLFNSEKFHGYLGRIGVVEKQCDLGSF